jgi:hypothetical protein
MIINLYAPGSTGCGRNSSIFLNRVDEPAPNLAASFEIVRRWIRQRLPSFPRSFWQICSADTRSCRAP